MWYFITRSKLQAWVTVLLMRVTSESLAWSALWPLVPGAGTGLCPSLLTPRRPLISSQESGCYKSVQCPGDAWCLVLGAMRQQYVSDCFTANNKCIASWIIYDFVTLFPAHVACESLHNHDAMRLDLEWDLWLVTGSNIMLVLSPRSRWAGHPRCNPAITHELPMQSQQWESSESQEAR